MEEKMGRKIGEVEENIFLIFQKVQEFEKKLKSTRTNLDDYKVMLASLVKVKLSTYDGKSSGQIYTHVQN